MAKPSSAYRQRVARAASEVPESLMLHGPMEGQPLKRQRNLDALRPSLESSTTVRGEVARRNDSGILWISEISAGLTGRWRGYPGEG